MVWVIHCDCGTDVTGHTEAEFVDMAVAHARASHALTMTKEQVLGLATIEDDAPGPKESAPGNPRQNS